jgi:HlyD family secretion protein
MQKNSRTLKRALIIGIPVLVIIIGIAAAAVGGDSTPAYEFTTVTRSSVIQEVSVTGRVKPAESAKLAFEKLGKVTAIHVAVGDQVAAGDALVALDSSELLAQLEQAHADVAAQRAKLNELLLGTRDEEIAVQKTKVQNSKVGLADAKNNLINTIQDGYTKADDAVYNKVDQFILNPKSQNPELSFTLTDQILKENLEAKRKNLETTLPAWALSLMTLTTESSLSAYAAAAKTNLNAVKSFLDLAGAAVNSLTPEGVLIQAVIDGYKADVLAARTNVNTAIANLTAANEKLSSAESGLLLAEQELTLLEAGSLSDAIVAQEALFQKAEANVAFYNAQLAKNTLRAPFAGIITEKNAKVGEIISANTTTIGIISEAEFEIETFTPEADIAKIKLGDAADVTLDAYGRDEFFTAAVAAIDPAETIIEGVSTYRVTLRFLQKDERVRSGMTAKITIATARRDNVLVIPLRALIRRNGVDMVRILRGDDVAEIPVTVGLRGSEGNAEIIGGLHEGDAVITFFQE